MKEIKNNVAPIKQTTITKEEYEELQKKIFDDNN